MYNSDKESAATTIPTAQTPHAPVAHFHQHVLANLQSHLFPLIFISLSFCSFFLQPCVSLQHVNRSFSITKRCDTSPKTLSFSCDSQLPEKRWELQHLVVLLLPSLSHFLQRNKEEKEAQTFTLEDNYYYFSHFFVLCFFLANRNDLMCEYWASKTGKSFHETSLFKIFSHNKNICFWIQRYWEETAPLTYIPVSLWPVKASLCFLCQQEQDL